MFEKIYKKLKENNIDAYSIGQHNGVCKNPIVIIKEYEPIEVVGASYYNNTVNLICYYPIGHYSKVKEFQQEVLNSMSELREFDREMVGEPISIDNDKKAYLFILRYNNKKLRRY